MSFDIVLLLSRTRRCCGWGSPIPFQFGRHWLPTSSDA